MTSARTIETLTGNKKTKAPVGAFFICRFRTLFASNKSDVLKIEWKFSFSADDAEYTVQVG